MFVHTTLADKSKRNEKKYSHFNCRSHFNPNYVHFQFCNSQAETTITQHSNNSPFFVLTKPLVVKGDGKIYPRNPTNGYVSKVSDGLFGCLGCGSSLNIFQECKNLRVPAVCRIYWQELWTHVPKTLYKSIPFFTIRGLL